MSAYRRLVIVGAAIWLGATVLIRLAGQTFLPVRTPVLVVLLFAASFGLCALLVRSACRGAHIRGEDWPAGAIAVLMPTLLLDPFSSAFFPVVFPNLPADAAGVFGGWMLCCCAGGLIGASVRRGARR
jgi:Family of unknown function (DUF5367)